MPYEIRGKCVYRKDTGKKVGCTEGDVKKYLAALHMHEEKEDMISENSIETRLKNTLGYFLSFGGRPSSNGMKLSVQGKTIEDAIELYNLVGTYLQQKNVAFKLGTPRLIAKNDPIQSKKLLTIYVPDDEDFNKFAETIYRKIKKYKGWYNIKTPPKYKHYAGGIFYRNDRDESGNYIPANKNEGRNMKLKEIFNDLIKEGIEGFLDKVKISDNSITLDRIKVQRTPKGNWAVYVDGKETMTLQGSLLSPKDAKKYNLLRVESIHNGQSKQLNESSYEIAKGNKSTKNSFGEEKLETPWSTGKKDECCKDYGISYEEAEKKLKGIKTHEALDEEYQNLIMQMNNSFDRNRFRICYNELRNKIGQKEFPKPTMTNRNK